jgi:hypothetical protein
MVMMGFNFGPAAAASMVGGVGLPMNHPVFLDFSMHLGLAPAAALGVAAILLAALGMRARWRRSREISGQMTAATV